MPNKILVKEMQVSEPQNILSADQKSSVHENSFFADDLHQMANAVNYRRWQLDLISPYIHGKVLEIGGGIGNFTADLAGLAESVVSIEPNMYCYSQLTEKVSSLTNVTALNIDAESLANSLPKGFFADTVVCMNVLEHIQDDVSAVGYFTRLLRTGGRIIILVPAVPAAFGVIDERLGHFRRYSKHRLTTLLTSSGFTLEKIKFFNLIGLLGWWWNARVSRRKNQSDIQIRFFDRFLVK
ncbi:MAG: methyltransferase domain-containing protein, partial [Patescibacteria group bacterium]|nr:methyltransferase domain-containing protein [Patescibacteria group bacterium]